MVQGCGDLVDVVQVGRQERVEVHSLSLSNGHARCPVTEVPAYAHHLGVYALSQLGLSSNLTHGGLQPHLIVILNSLRLSYLFVKDDVIGIGLLTDLVDPGVIVAERAIHVRKLVMDRYEVVIPFLQSIVGWTGHPTMLCRK